MPTQTLLHPSPAITTLHYNPSPNPYNTSQTSLSSSTRLYNTTLPYDSDNEPLLRPSAPPSFTTPLVQSSSSPQHEIREVRRPSVPTTQKLHSLLAPPLLPISNPTDESIIPAIITNVIPSPTSLSHQRSKSRSKLKSHLPILQKFKKEASGEEKGITKVVFMPRKEYLKYFARGTEGEYVGTEEYRRWTEEELEREFGGNKPDCLRRENIRRRL